jgi:hypothetical protein
VLQKSKVIALIPTIVPSQISIISTYSFSLIT